MADVFDCHVCEVGAGPGSLTRSLLQAGAKHVAAVEIDGRFMPSLEVFTLEIIFLSPVSSPVLWFVFLWFFCKPFLLEEIISNDLFSSREVFTSLLMDVESSYFFELISIIKCMIFLTLIAQILIYYNSLFHERQKKKNS